MEKITYTEKEIEALNYYTSRKSTEVFENNRRYEHINGFLKYLSHDKHRDKTLPNHYKDIAAIKKQLNDIVNLYSLACKYGFTHRAPRVVYRGDYSASDIRIDSYEYMDMPIWDTNAFLSCSRVRAEAASFSGGDGPVIEISLPKIDNEQNNIPFIDVNDLLGTDQFYGDEREILFPPFLKTIVMNTSLNSYEINMTPMCSLPTEDVKIDDDFLTEYLLLSNKVLETHDYDGLDSQKLDLFRLKMKNYLKDILSKIKFITDRLIKGFISNEDYETYIDNITSFIKIDDIKETKKLI